MQGQCRNVQFDWQIKLIMRRAKKWKRGIHNFAQLVIAVGSFRSHLEMQNAALMQTLNHSLDIEKSITCERQFVKKKYLLQKMVA